MSWKELCIFQFTMFYHFMNRGEWIFGITKMDIYQSLLFYPSIPPTLASAVILMSSAVEGQELR